MKRIFALKPLLFACLPVVLSGFISSLVLLNSVSANLNRQTSEFGSAISSQLAITLTEHLVNRDDLSLNVLLTDLVDEQYFEFASVYGVDNNLIAQAGTPTSDSENNRFTTDISFQNEITGYVEVGVYTDANKATVVDSILIILSLHLVLMLGIIIFKLDPAWLSNLDLASRLKISADQPFRKDSHEKSSAQDQLTLVIKISPRRFTSEYLAWINSGTALYGGKLISHEGGELVLLFSSSNQVFDAICCAWLMKSILKYEAFGLEFKAGVHLDSGGELEGGRKHASYLASISTNALLVSKKIFATLEPRDDITLSDFHNSAVHDGHVYAVSSLGAATTQLIDRQVQHITG